MPESVHNRALVLIVASPDRARGSLRALLRTLPQIEVLDPADDGPSALRIIAERRPSLVILDSDLPGDETWNVLKRIKSEWPQTRCIVLASSAQQRQAAIAFRADSVLLKGFQTEQLFASIDKLLAPQDER